LTSEGCHLRPSLPSFSALLGLGLQSAFPRFLGASGVRSHQGSFQAAGNPDLDPLRPPSLSLFILSFSSHEHCSIHHESINRHQPDFLALARGTSTLAHRRRLLSNSARLFFLAEKRISPHGFGRSAFGGLRRVKPASSRVLAQPRPAPTPHPPPHPSHRGWGPSPVLPSVPNRD
jgi:hypothetical protein